MYTSDNNVRVIVGERARDTRSHRAARRALVWLYISIFTALLGAVYEHFSFGVYSAYMIYAFAVPLVLGCLPSLLCAVKGSRPAGRPSGNLYASAVATLTVGSIFTGIVEIYGTTNRLSAVYLIAGVAMLALSVLIYIAEPLICEKNV